MTISKDRPKDFVVSLIYDISTDFEGEFISPLKVCGYIIYLNPKARISTIRLYIVE